MGGRKERNTQRRKERNEEKRNERKRRKGEEDIKALSKVLNYFPNRVDL